MATKDKKSSSRDDLSHVRGQPGYRTRPGRSGLDYVDNEAEAGHMLGVFFRRLFSGRLRTRNPVYLALMVLACIVTLFPEGLAVSLLIDGDPSWLPLMFTMLPFGLFGAALLVNLVKNFREQGK